MNRKIKFRVWNKSTSEFYFLDLSDVASAISLSGYNKDKSIYYVGSSGANLGGELCQVRPALFGNLVVQQYTGLKDKNGKEIYEGDIISEFVVGEEGNPYYPSRTEIGQICYSTLGDFRVEPDGTPLFDWEQAEVIGNICENPDLLK